MDSKCRRNGRLIDMVSDEWRAERLPHEDIQVPLEELPDPEADSADSHLTLKEQSMRWQENFPELEKINIREQIPKYVNAQVKLLTTRCIIIETEKIAKVTQGALTILKQFSTHECGHKEPVSGAKCIFSMIGKYNDKHYILATQDRDLQEKLRHKSGVPLLYLHNKSPTLEKPSQASYDKIEKSTDSNNFMFISETQNEALTNMKKALGVQTNEEETKIKIKKKKLHNPNPLSCKKKKKKPHKNVDANKNVSEGRVRKKKKAPKYKKELLKNAAVTT